MAEILFVGGPWDRTIRQVKNSGDLIAKVDGLEVFYTNGRHQMPSEELYLIATSSDANIQDIPVAIRDTGHQPFA